MFAFYRFRNYWLWLNCIGLFKYLKKDVTSCNTLESLINVQQNLIVFWQFSFLHALIPSYTFINFWENYLPTRLFHPTRLLKLNFICRWALEKYAFFDIFPKFFWIFLSVSWFFLICHDFSWSFMNFLDFSWIFLEKFKKKILPTCLFHLTWLLLLLKMSYLHDYSILHVYSF